MCLCFIDEIKIGPCDNSENSDPIILSYDYTNKANYFLGITINTSNLYDSIVCMKFLRNDNKVIMMSDQFHLQVINSCP